jgi:hypothetical protein
VRVVVLFAAAQVLWGQSSLTGRVVDENEIPVSLARIAVAAAGEVRQATSGPTGLFSVVIPGPGDYLVNVQREGFYELRDHLVHVDASNEITLVLTPIREVFQSVDVNERPSPVDTGQTARELTLTGTEVNDVPYPGSHSLRNSIKLIPGVVQDQSGALHFEGAQESQVLYTLNGFNLGDPLTGRFDTRLAVEGIRSLEFWSGRYSPEFGKGSAGVLAIHTETGTDELHYTATNFIPGIDTHNGVQLGNWTPRFGLSGPIRRGRAWFADNFDAQYDQGFVSDLPAGQNRRTGWGGSNLMHTQVNVKPSNILFVDFLVNFNVQNHAGLGVLDPAPTTTTQRGREYFVSVKDQMYFGHGLLVELGYAHNYFYTRQIPQGTAIYIQAPTGRSGNYFVDSTQKTTRDQLLADAFLPEIHFAGTHQVKIGTDLDRLGYSADFRRTRYEQIGLAGEVLSMTKFRGSGVFERPSAEASSYILDTWRLRKNLQVDLGVRQDWDELIRQVIVSPRASLAYSPFASGNTRISAGYAITSDATSLALFSQPLDQQAITVRYNPDGTVAGPPAVSAFIIDNPHLKAPRSINWSGSIDRQLPHRINASVNYLWRHTRDGLTYAAGDDGLFHLTNLRRDAYHSASVVVRQTLAGGYEWMASYTRSSATSNAVLNLSVDQTMQVLNNFGAMPWDSPNRYLGTAYLPVPRFKEWAIAVLADARSGFPFSVVDQNGTVSGAVNSRRYPSNFDLNVHLERRFTLHGYRFALRGGLNNVLDRLNPTAVNNTIGSPQFLQFFGHEGRHFVVRIRFFGRAGS